jgi:hypothetical protein
MRRILIVSAVMLALLSTLVPQASAAQAYGCRKRTSHKAVCWNYKGYPIFFKCVLHFYNGTLQTYWFTLNPDDRWRHHTALAIKSVSWDSWRM